ncbi:MAG: hypothetical protein F6K65_04580 [Moorea sp. SIO3C2]|nr:hypothetical protein [Moorena sp. SIO3C2]
MQRGLGGSPHERLHQELMAFPIGVSDLFVLTSLSCTASGFFPFFVHLHQFLPFWATAYRG